VWVAEFGVDPFPSLWIEGARARGMHVVASRFGGRPQGAPNASSASRPLAQRPSVLVATTRPRYGAPGAATSTSGTRSDPLSRSGRRRPTHPHRQGRGPEGLKRPGALSDVVVLDEPGFDAVSDDGTGRADSDGETSYSKLYDRVFARPLRMSKPVLKPSKEAQMKEEDSQKLWWSDVFVTVKRNYFLKRKYHFRDLLVMVLIGGVHLGCLWAPATFSWGAVALCMAAYFVTGCVGITFGYHRLLAHRSFVVPKWIEYTASYCGVLSIQGDPIEWASTHRYHHLHTDTPLDPHSTYEGAWWSHTGWIIDNEVTMSRTRDHSNARDLQSQAFYRHLQKTHYWHVALSFAALYAFGGLPALVWGGCVRTVIVWHITWSVNSFCHIYGGQDYNTKDLSKNNWLFGLLAWGEGWHNNHHAFEFSARHGLKWWQFDLTWIIISSLQKLGLATKVRLPTEAQKKRLAFPE